jgi:hypothetical protein
VLGGATGGLLLGSVAVRLVQDSRLFGSAGSDPFAAALLAVELVILGVAALLGVACLYIARRTWTGRMGRLPTAIVFGVILLGSLLVAVRGGTGAILAGLLAILSGATLFFHFNGHSENPRTKAA